MEQEELETEPSLQIISAEDEKRINDELLYQKWREDGKYEHKRRDMEKRIKKANAARKAKTGK